MKRLIWLVAVACLVAPVSEVNAAVEDDPQLYVFFERVIDSVNEFYKGSELDKEIRSVFSEFHQHDGQRNLEFQSRIQGLADQQKDLYVKIPETLKGAVDSGNVVQKTVFQSMSTAVQSLLEKNRMFSDVLQGREDHSRNDYVKKEREGWEHLLTAAHNFPFLVHEASEAKGGKGAISYKISKQQRADLLKLLDRHFGKAKPEMIAEIKAGNRDRSKPSAIINYVIIKLYESLQFDTYKERKSQAVTDLLFHVAYP